jgi:hypothetical protein
MSSRYWRQPEYELKADVTKARARRTPSSRIRASVAGRYGSQFRFPQYTGRSSPAAASSASTAATRPRFWALIGLTPPNSW